MSAASLLKDSDVHSWFCFHCEDTEIYDVGQSVMCSTKAEQESINLGVITVGNANRTLKSSSLFYIDQSEI